MTKRVKSQSRSWKWQLSLLLRNWDSAEFTSSLVKPEFDPTLHSLPASTNDF
eukprot:m.44867 g.44867  ORF g.44867 m.44867 type:complete len:52 (+) comp8576_c0_seq1:502-657(+)